MTTKPTIKEILQNLFDDYWKKNEIGCYVYEAQELVDKYNRLCPQLNIKPGQIPDILAKNGLRHVRGVCKHCGTKIYARSRNSYYRRAQCECRIVGKCLQCQKPYEKDQSKNRYCLNCYIYQCERQIEESHKQIANYEQQCEEYRKHIANHDKKIRVSESLCTNDNVLADLSEKEIWILYMVKDHANRFMKKQECDLGKLSTDLVQSLSQTAKLLKSLINEKLIIGEVYAPGNRYHLFSAKIVRLNVALPDKKIDFPFLRTVHPIIPSDPADELYKVLRRGYPCVIPEQAPSVFLNKDKFFEKLDSEERKRFLNMRFNFVCVDESGKPVLVAQYNGQHNFADKYGRAKRALQEKLCRMANIELLQINSYEELLKFKKSIEGTFLRS